MGLRVHGDTVDMGIMSQPGGFPLQNGTPTILQVSVPNDGVEHPVLVWHNIVVSSTTTGGGVQLQYTLQGALRTMSLTAGGLPPGIFGNNAAFVAIADPGTSIIILQNTAMTAGAANEHCGIAVLG